MSGNFPKSIKQLCKNLHGSICALCDIYIELGEVAHIISNRGKEKGPRFFTEYPTLTYRNLIDVKNSIYLCRNCHINIDDNKQSGKYSPEYLINARKIHIEKMRILELSKDDHKIEIDKEKNQKWSQLNQHLKMSILYQDLNYNMISRNINIFLENDYNYMVNFYIINIIDLMNDKLSKGEKIIGFIHILKKIFDNVYHNEKIAEKILILIKNAIDSDLKILKISPLNTYLDNQRPFMLIDALNISKKIFKTHPNLIEYKHSIITLLSSKYRCNFETVHEYLNN